MALSNADKRLLLNTLSRELIDINKKLKQNR